MNETVLFLQFLLPPIKIHIKSVTKKMILLYNCFSTPSICLTAMAGMKQNYYILRVAVIKNSTLTCSWM